MDQLYSQPEADAPKTPAVEGGQQEIVSEIGEAPTVFPNRPEFFIPMAKPTWTRILIGCNLVVFVAMIAYGWLVYHDPDGPSNGQVLVTFGAKVNELIAQGEFWRLFTAMFLHIGTLPPLHLLFNLYALNSIGPLVEGFFGHRRFLFVYLLGGLFGSLASYAFSPALSAGASGAIFALVGGATVYFLRYHQNFGSRGRAILQNMVVVIVINLIFGYSMPGIDNWGHIGGLLGGALVAFGILPRYQAPAVVRLGAQPLDEAPNWGLEALWLILCIALFIAGVFFATRYQLAHLGQ